MAAVAVTIALVGRAACGCVRAVSIDSVEHLAENAREMKRWTKAGLVISREDLEAVRREIGKCKRGLPSWGRKCPQVAIEGEAIAQYEEDST